MQESSKTQFTLYELIIVFLLASVSMGIGFRCFESVNLGGKILISIFLFVVSFSVFGRIQAKLQAKRRFREFLDSVIVEKQDRCDRQVRVCYSVPTEYLETFLGSFVNNIGHLESSSVRHERYVLEVFYPSDTSMPLLDEINRR